MQVTLRELAVRLSKPYFEHRGATPEAALTIDFLLTNDHGRYHENKSI